MAEAVPGGASGLSTYRHQAGPPNRPRQWGRGSSARAGDKLPKDEKEQSDVLVEFKSHKLMGSDDIGSIYPVRLWDLGFGFSWSHVLATPCRFPIVLISGEDDSYMFSGTYSEWASCMNVDVRVEGFLRGD